MKTKLNIALLAVAVIAYWAGSADADVARIAGISVAAQGPNCAEPVAAPCQPTITYLHHGCRKACCGCEPPIQTALEVKIPSCDCTCTTLAIPVCLPACCTGTPRMICHQNIFGRGVVRYDYCCGVIVKIVIRPCGDIIVHYIHA